MQQWTHTVFSAMTVLKLQATAMISECLLLLYDSIVLLQDKHSQSEQWQVSPLFMEYNMTVTVKWKST